jgi:hypothetical protein
MIAEYAFCLPLKAIMMKTILGSKVVLIRALCFGLARKYLPNDMPRALDFFAPFFVDMQSLNLPQKITG